MKTCLHHHNQSGAALIVTLLVLVIITLMAVTSSRTSSLEEKMTQATRSRNLAFQAAESALHEGRIEFRTPNGTTRDLVFLQTEAYSSNCGQTAYNNGGLNLSGTANTQRQNLCRDLPVSPATLLGAGIGTNRGEYAREGGGAQVEGFSVVGAADSGTASVAQQPRYLIEALCNVPIPGASATGVNVCNNKRFRVTAIGFGSSAQTVSYVQEVLVPMGAK